MVGMEVGLRSYHIKVPSQNSETVVRCEDNIFIF